MLYFIYYNNRKKAKCYKLRYRRKTQTRTPFFIAALRKPHLTILSLVIYVRNLLQKHNGACKVHETVKNFGRALSKQIRK